MRRRLAGVAISLAALMFSACSAPSARAATGTHLSPIKTATTPVIFAPSATPPPAAATVSSATPLVPRTPEPPTPASSQAPGAALHQLTSGGCCVQPFWSADGSQVRYIDRPSSGQPSGVWQVSANGGQASFVTARLGIYSPDEKLVAYPESGQTYIERVGGERWTVDNGGRAIVFSPDSARIAWQAASSLVNFDSRLVQIWVAGVDGSGTRKVTELAGGGLAGWFPDGRRLLVTSRDGDFGLVQALRIADGGLSIIARAARIQGAMLSPQGGWVAYAIAFSGDASLDGLWVVPAKGGDAQRLDAFGGFAWRGEGRMLIIPLEASASSNRLLEIDAATGAQRSLTDPTVIPFQIAGGNWALSPDGSHLAFVSATDHNIWVLDLPE